MAGSTAEPAAGTESPHPRSSVKRPAAASGSGVNSITAMPRRRAAERRGCSSPRVTRIALALMRVSSAAQASAGSDGSTGANVHDAGSVAIATASSGRDESAAQTMSPRRIPQFPSRSRTYRICVPRSPYVSGARPGTWTAYAAGWRSLSSARASAIVSSGLSMDSRFDTCRGTSLCYENVPPR